MFDRLRPSRVDAYHIMLVSVLGLIVIVTLREILGYYFSQYIKIISDLLIALIFITVLVKRKFKVTLVMTDYIFISFLAIIVLSLIVNQSDILSATLQVRGVIGYYLVYFSIRNFNLNELQSSHFIYYISRIITYLLIYISLFALVELISHKELLFPIEWVNNIRLYNINRVYSLLNNPNIFGAFLLTGMLIVRQSNIYLGMHTARYLYFVVAIGIISSQSRSAALGVLIILTIYLIPKSFTKVKKVINNNTFKKNIVIGIITIASVASVIVIISSLIPKTEYGQNRYLDLVNGNELNNSKIDGRLYIINNSLEIYRNNNNYLLGIGPGMLNNQQNETNQYGLAPGFTTDNQHLKTFVELGILGYITFIMIIFAVLIRFKKNTMVATLVILMFFWGIFYNSFEIHTIALYFWLAVSIAELGKALPKKNVIAINASRV